MKKYSAVTAGLAVVLAVSLCGCSAKDGYTGTDIGGTGIKNDGEGGGFFDKIAGAFGGKAEMDAIAPTEAGGAMMEADYAAPSAAVTPGSVVPGGIDPEESVPEIKPQAGLLTGGEWNDNEHWADWKALYETRDDWNGYKDEWRIKGFNRLAVKVVANGKPVENAKVSSPNGGAAVTDNKGMAYLFYEGMVDSSISVSHDDFKTSTSMQVEWVDPNTDSTLTVELDGTAPEAGKKLDFMIMCDTTGSMSDELEYLKAELEDIVKTIKSQNANIPTRISVNFYRDEGDEYEVRQFPFSENINDVVKAIGEQSANGGGDFPEAVHSALKSAVDGHDWDKDSVKIMFLVLDAPPHNDPQIVDEVNKYVAKAAELGIRIIPIASSGIDKSTEYLLRVMAQMTGGTYTFLTNDSGIGGDHIEATVGAYNVEKLKDMMVRIVSEYLE